MFGAIKSLLGIGPAVDFAELKKQGAIILDVRTKGEFNGGHIRGAQNIPVDQIAAQSGKFKKDQVIITCCASGMRSGSAKSILKSKGFTQVYNGGSWHGLEAKMKK